MTEVRIMAGTQGNFVQPPVIPTHVSGPISELWNVTIVRGKHVFG